MTPDSPEFTRIPWHPTFSVPHPDGIDPQTTRDQILHRLETLDGAAVASRHGHSAPARRPPCPRCATPGAHRWGAFSGRQRWRCLGCKRTFSTFTGSVLFRIRRLDAWDHFAHHLWGTQSLRQAALTLGINKDTALKWRLRLLDALRYPSAEAGLDQPNRRGRELAPLSPAIPLGQLFLLPVMGRATHTKRTLGTLPEHRNALGALVLRLSGPTIQWVLADIAHKAAPPAWAKANQGSSFAISDAAHAYLCQRAPVLLSPAGRPIRLHSQAQLTSPPITTEAASPPPHTSHAQRAHEARRICRRTGTLFRRWFARFHGIGLGNEQRYLDWFIRLIFPTLQRVGWDDLSRDVATPDASRMLSQPGFPITR